MIKYKNIEKLKYHVFSDGVDELVKTQKEARRIIKEWEKEGYYNFRVYSCEWNEIDGTYDDVDCILSTGSYPY